MYAHLSSLLVLKAFKGFCGWCDEPEISIRLALSLIASSGFSLPYDEIDRSSKCRLSIGEAREQAKKLYSQEGLISCVPLRLKAVGSIKGNHAQVVFAGHHIPPKGTESGGIFVSRDCSWPFQNRR